MSSLKTFSEQRGPVNCECHDSSFSFSFTKHPQDVCMLQLKELQNKTAMFMKCLKLFTELSNALPSEVTTTEQYKTDRAAEIENLQLHSCPDIFVNYWARALFAKKGPFRRLPPPHPSTHTHTYW